jgi:hypothetical protein
VFRDFGRKKNRSRDSGSTKKCDQSGISPMSAMTADAKGWDFK